jgi:hypothetical protein
MLEITTCPDCDKKLRLPDRYVGKKCRCPGCRVTFVAQPDAVEDEAPARAGRSNGFSERRSAPERRHDDLDRPRRRDDDYDDDYDRGSRGSAAAKGWRGARMGLLLVIIANWTTLATIGIAIIGGGILLLTGASLLGSVASSGPRMSDAQAQRAAAGAVGMGVGVIIFFILLGLFWFAAAILQLVGQGICMMVPNRRGNALRGLAIAAFGCACGAILMTILGGVLVQARVGRASQGTQLGANALTLASFICWILFLRLVALECRVPDLAGRLVVYLISNFVGGFLAVILVIIAACAGGAMLASQVSSSNPSASNTLGALGAFGIIMAIVVGLIGLAWLGLFIWYTLLLQQVRGAITRHLDRL